MVMIAYMYDKKEAVNSVEVGVLGAVSKVLGALSSTK